MILFLSAIFSVCIGILLAVKNQTPVNEPEQQAYVALEERAPAATETQTETQTIVNDTPTESIKATDPNEIQTAQSNEPEEQEADEESESMGKEDQNATSYDDELASEDDAEEGDETAKTDDKPEEKLPAEAEKVIEDLLDVADEALRIQDQFSYTVTNGDKLKDVLEQSGLGNSVAKALIRQYPSLGNLEAGQQFYWVLDKHGELEYMNWLVSEKEERIYERQSNGSFAYQKIEKQGGWRQDVVRGVIQGSFASSLKDVGLSDRQIEKMRSFCHFGETRIYQRHCD